MTPIDELFAQAVARHQAGDLDGAESLYRQVLNDAPQHAGTLSNLGVLSVRLGKLDEAVRLYTAAIAANPNQLDAHFNLGNVYRKLNRPADAVGAYQAVLRLNPQHPRAYLNLGLVADEVGDGAAALDCFRRAIVLDPDYPEAYNLLADSLMRAGRLDESIAVYRQFAARCPDEPRAHNNLGLALATRGEHEAALAELEQALKLRPDYPDAHNLLGVTLESLHRVDEAQQHYREAVRLRPEFAEAWSNLGTSLTEQGRIGEAIAALRKAMAIRPEPRTGSNLLLALGYSSEFTPAQLRDEHVAWATKFASGFSPAPVNRKDPAPRLKIGYVSGDFRAHTVAGLIELLLTHHDRNAFHVTCYANVPRPDDVTDRLRRLADVWKPIHTMTDAQLAGAVIADEIDVLIDLSGHTAGNRLLAFARKPAAAQFTMFGYPCTTGLSAIDFRISDPFADPPGETDGLSIEKMKRLSNVAWVYKPPENAPAPNKLPSQSRRSFTFGCLNNPAKLSDACLAAWAQILKAVPKSRLVLMAGRSAEAARLLSERFTQLGIASDRLEIVYRLPASEYFEAYQPIDLCLDPFPYNGGVTTCDSLWMGVPVLTLAGADYRSRQGVSILNNIGLPEFVADTPDKLIELAATWADQRDGLADLRGSLREMMQQSPLTDAASYVRQLEAVYRSCRGADL